MENNKPVQIVQIVSWIQQTHLKFDGAESRSLRNI